MKRIATVVVGIAIAACGKGKQAGRTDDKIDATTIAAVNAAVPADWKTKLSFEAVSIVNHQDPDKPPTMAIAPRGWKPGFLGDELVPDKSNQDFGSDANLRVGKSCGGDCAARPSDQLARAADKAFFANVLAAKPAPTVVKDVKSPGGRTLVAAEATAEGGVKDVLVIVTWWKDGDERFGYCAVTLGDQALAPAFEQACTALAH